MASTPPSQVPTGTCDYDHHLDGIYAKHDHTKKNEVSSDRNASAMKTKLVLTGTLWQGVDANAVHHKHETGKLSKGCRNSFLQHLSLSQRCQVNTADRADALTASRRSTPIAQQNGVTNAQWLYKCNLKTRACPIPRQWGGRYFRSRHADHLQI